jgi:acyl carrier protein
MDEAIRKEVITIISNLTKIPEESIDPKVDFSDSGIDSFSLVEIVYAIENRYDVDIPQDSLLEVRNLEGLLGLLETLLKNRG